MSREAHVQFWERVGVQLPRATHLPLYRQEQIFAQRHKINLSRASLASWVELCADWLQPIYEQIRTGVMAGGYAQIDETPVSGPPAAPVAMCSIAGKPAARPNVSRDSFRAPSRAWCNVAATTRPRFSF